MRSTMRIELTLLVCLLLGANTPLLACECIAPADFDQWVLQEFERATLVFAGTASATTDVDFEALETPEFQALTPDEFVQRFASAEVEFQVYASFKGDTYGTVRVRTDSMLSSCSLRIEVGERLIVFAYAIENDDMLRIHLCTPTARRHRDIESSFQRILALLLSDASPPRRDFAPN